MANTLVVCFYGTANSPTLNDTNVIKIARLFRSGKDNIVFYDPGVGTLPKPGTFSVLRSKINRLSGLIAGGGLIQNVSEAYEFICNHYTEKCKLVFVGFSRGAFSARILASIIHQVGVLVVAP